MAGPIDAHNHLQDEWLAPHREACLRSLEEAGIEAAVVNGTEEGDWDDVRQLARERPWVWPSLGLHPWRVAERSAAWEKRLEQAIAETLAEFGWCGVGEIGLDRWKEPYDWEDQRAVFRRQLAMAADGGLPLTIHCLEAWGPLLEELQRQHRPEQGFLIHAYGGSGEMAARFAGLGAYFSFSGYFLHERKEARREVFRHIPVERLLVETDAPAMPLPVEKRRFSLPDTPEGDTVNHPANLTVTYRALAELRAMPLGQLQDRIAANFHALFGTGPQKPAGPR